MCHWEIDQKHPTPDKNQQRCEFHSLSNGTHDQRRSNDRKHQLKHRIDVLRYPVSVIGVRRGSDAIKEEELGSAIEWVIEILAEDEAVSKSPPENSHHPGDSQALG